GSVGVKQLYERRGKTICSDYDDALPATLMLRRLIVFAGHDAHGDPGREEPTREQQSVNERHRAWDAIETRKREQHGESHEFGKKHRLRDIQRIVHRKITRHPVLEPKREE